MDSLRGVFADYFFVPFFSSFFLSSSCNSFSHGRPLCSPDRTARPYHIHQKAATANRRARSRTLVSRWITATVVPMLYRPRVNGEVGVGVRVYQVRSFPHSLLHCLSPFLSFWLLPSLSLSVSLSLSAGKVDLGGGRSYYLLFSPSTNRGSFHPVKPST